MIYFRNVFCRVEYLLLIFATGDEGTGMHFMKLNVEALENSENICLWTFC